MNILRSFKTVKKLRKENQCLRYKIHKLKEDVACYKKLADFYHGMHHSFFNDEIKRRNELKKEINRKYGTYLKNEYGYVDTDSVSNSIQDFIDEIDNQQIHSDDAMDYSEFVEYGCFVFNKKKDTYDMILTGISEKSVKERGIMSASIKNKHPFASCKEDETYDLTDVVVKKRKVYTKTSKWEVL